MASIKSHCLAKTDENVASFSFGVRMYNRKAELCHLPNAWIVESSMPASAAVVAAPILKLWPAYWCCGKPMSFNNIRIY